MRLPVSFLVAIALHGVAWGVADASAHRGAPQPTIVADIPVEVDVVAAHPDPVRDIPVVAVKAAPAPARLPSATSTAPKDEKPRVASAEESTSNEDTMSEAPIPVLQAAASAPAEAIAPSPATSAGVSVRATGPSTPARASSFVSAAPRYRANPPPEYPIPSRRRGEEGVVLLNVVVKTDGQAASVSLNHGSGYALLDRAALEAVRHWSFEPARTGGIPITSSVVVPVRFSLSN